jgi:hypothetical protein
MECRAGCGACCIAPSISSPIPGMPAGKPAGVRCVQLDAGNRCRIYGLPERPAVCSRLRARVEMCGATRQDALAYLAHLERATAPRLRASDPHDPRRDRDPREPEPIEPPARREPDDDPDQGPLPEPPVEDPLDAPGAGEPAWRDPSPREPPRVEP